MTRSYKASIGQPPTTTLKYSFRDDVEYQTKLRARIFRPDVAM